MKLSCLVEGMSQSELIKLLIGKKSRIRDRFVNADGSLKPDAERDLLDVRKLISNVDPSEKYMQFIVKSYASGTLILPEDSQRMADTILGFIRFSKMSNWEGSKNIMEYDDWKDLERKIQDIQKTHSSLDDTKIAKSQLKTFKENMAKGGTVLFTKTISTSSGGVEYQLIRCATPQSATFYGTGSNWCTTYSMLTDKLSISDYIKDQSEDHSMNYIISNKYSIWKTTKDLMKFNADLNGVTVEQLYNWDKSKKNKNPILLQPLFFKAMNTAADYLKSGPLWIIKRNGMPYMQFESNGNQVKDEFDYELYSPSKQLAIILYYMLPYTKDLNLYYKIFDAIKISSLHEFLIVKDPVFAYDYAISINKRFEKGEDLIKSVPDLWNKYSKHFNIQ
jgi:hypothetical protein